MVITLCAKASEIAVTRLRCDEITKIWLRQSGRCVFCERVMDIGSQTRTDSASIEHVIPKSRGGLNHPSNYAASCIRCNTLRGNADYEEFRRWVQFFLRRGDLGENGSAQHRSLRGLVINGKVNAKHKVRIRSR